MVKAVFMFWRLLYFWVAPHSLYHGVSGLRSSYIYIIQCKRALECAWVCPLPACLRVSVYGGVCTCPVFCVLAISQSSTGHTITAGTLCRRKWERACLLISFISTSPFNAVGVSAYDSTQLWDEAYVQIATLPIFVAPLLSCPLLGHMIKMSIIKTCLIW